jgi:hypothetical protein
LSASLRSARRQSRIFTLILIGLPFLYLFFVVVDATLGVGARIPTVTSPFQGRAIPVAALWLEPAVAVQKS